MESTRRVPESVRLTVVRSCSVTMRSLDARIASAPRNSIFTPVSVFSTSTPSVVVTYIQRSDAASSERIIQKTRLSVIRLRSSFFLSFVSFELFIGFVLFFPAEEAECARRFLFHFGNQLIAEDLFKGVLCEMPLEHSVDRHGDRAGLFRHDHYNGV